MLNWSQNPRIFRATKRLRQGGVIAYPTEAVWGLGCNPLDGIAVNYLLALKGRSVTKGLILIAATMQQLQPFIKGLNEKDQRLLVASESLFDAAPITWVVPASSVAPYWLTGGRETIAVRITSHPVASGLCQAFGGPLVSTSANPQGLPPARTGFKVRQYFGDQLADITPGQVGQEKGPSQIKELLSGRTLRPGE